MEGVVDCDHHRVHLPGRVEGLQQVESIVRAPQQTLFHHEETVSAVVLILPIDHRNRR